MTEVIDPTGTQLPPAFAGDIVASSETRSVGGDATPPSAEQALPDQPSFDERGGIVSARGTADGLALRLDGRVERETLRNAISDFMVARREFLAGQGVCLEWVGRLPDDGFVKDISEFLEAEYDVVVRTSRPLERERYSRPMRPSLDAGEDISIRKSGSLRVKPGEMSSGVRLERTPSLFDGVEALGREVHAAASRGLAGREAIWDEPDCRMVYSTLRSGQKIESEHSVVVFGDVNSGAEIIAGGDIVVLGTLRGMAHAGAYDETGGGRVIFGLTLQPTQLRIGGVISRGEAEGGDEPELARVEGTMIMVESYRAKEGARKRR